MADQWSWAAIRFNEISSPDVNICAEIFTSPLQAREHLRAHLDTFPADSTEVVAAHLIQDETNSSKPVRVTYPSHTAWAVYPIGEGMSAEHAAWFYTGQKSNEIMDDLKSDKPKITVDAGTGCAVAAIAALGAAGALAAAWARIRWT